MKKYEFKNYITHKSVEIHVEKVNHKNTYVVWYSCMGKPDRNPHGTAGCDNSAEYCAEEADAIRRAVNYVSQ